MERGIFFLLNHHEFPVHLCDSDIFPHWNITPFLFTLSAQTISLLLFTSSACMVIFLIEWLQISCSSVWYCYFFLRIVSTFLFISVIRYMSLKKVHTTHIHLLNMVVLLLLSCDPHSDHWTVAAAACLTGRVRQRCGEQRSISTLIRYITSHCAGDPLI